MNTRDVTGLLGLALVVGLFSRIFLSGYSSGIINAFGSSFSNIIQAATLSTPPSKQ